VPFDDDGWGEEETAIFLAINEDMREEARWWAMQQEKEDCQCDLTDDVEQSQFDDVEGFSGRRLRPFEQFVQDYLNGKKGIDDPMYGPGKKGRRSDAVDKKATILGVRIHGAHMVSEKLLSAIAHVLTAVEQISIKKIYFDSSGGPVVKGRSVHGIFDARSREIRINLRSLWQMAVEIAAMQRNHLRLDVLVWHGLLETLFHECFHAIDTEEGAPPEIQFCDEHATFWAQNMVVALGRYGDIEPPDVNEDPFYGPRIKKFLEENHQSSRFQHQLFNAGVVYRNETVEAEIKDLKTYYAVLAGDDCGIYQQEALQKILNLEAQYLDKLNKRYPMEDNISIETEVDATHDKKQDSDTSLEFYLYMAAELLKHERNADDRRALEYTERALKIAPVNIDALMNRGLAACRLGLYNIAIESYSLASKHDPQNDEPCAAMGYVLNKVGKYKGAIEWLNKATESNPYNYNAYNNRAVAYYQLGDYENALMDSKKCVKFSGPSDFYDFLIRKTEI
jgi:tetratricopeptide (TPR) repeat protein